jgi:hypothetical protein
LNRWLRLALDKDARDREDRHDDEEFSRHELPPKVGCGWLRKRRDYSIKPLSEADDVGHVSTVRVVLWFLPHVHTV